MEGLEISEVTFDYVQKNSDIFRIDSYFFAKEFLRDEDIISLLENQTLRDLGANLKSFGAYSLNNEVEYLNEGIPFIRGVNLKNGFIDFNDLIFISNEANELLWKSQVTPETILLSMSGTIGDVAIAMPQYQYPINSNQDIAKINLPAGVNPYFIYVFLLSKYGQNYLKREARGSVQQHVFLSQMELFKIPILNDCFEKKIENLIIQIHGLFFESKNLYHKAETLLLETIGLNNFKPSSEPVNVKSFKDSFGATGRLDAEYYQRKYDILENAIISQKHKKIKEIRKDNFRGLQPVYVEDGDLDVINSKHILEDSLDYNNFEKTSSKYWNTQMKARVFKGDILTYTTGANIGRTQVYQLDKKALASNHVNIIRLKEENPLYIGFVLNSLVGRMQTDKFSAGSAQAELYPKDLDQFLIPIIANSQQEKITQLIEESFQLKKQSESLLDLAKRAVEIAIEQGETEALKLLKNN